MLRMVRTRAVGALMAAVVVGGACGGGDGGADDDAAGEDAQAATSVESTTDSTTGTTAGAASSTTAPATPEDELIRDYEEAIATASSLYNPPDPESPLLEEHFTGAALERVRGSIRGVMIAGGAAENTIETHPRDIVITGDTATLTDCFTDHTQMLDLTTGRPVGEPGETTMEFAVQLERVDGVWKVARQTEVTSPCTA